MRIVNLDTEPDGDAFEIAKVLADLLDSMHECEGLARVAHSRFRRTGDIQDLLDARRMNDSATNCRNQAQRMIRMFRICPLGYCPRCFDTTEVVEGIQFCTTEQLQAINN